MRKQTLEYINEMESMYKTIMKKCLNEGSLTDLDVMFLKIYKKTIEKEGLV